MAGTSGHIPDFEVNVFGQLCRPTPRPTAIPGPSGCVPDFEVNVFGQLCRPARRSASLPSPEDDETDVDDEGQVNGASVSSTCKTDDVPTSDRISELFQKNQVLIRSLSESGNVEDYLATVKNVFKEVRQSRRDFRSDDIDGQKMAAVRRQDSPCVESSPAETQEADLRLGRGKLAQSSEADRCMDQERDQEPCQLRRRSQSHRSDSAHQFAVRHDEQDEDEDVEKLFCKEGSKRRGRMVHQMCSHVIM